LRKLRLSNEETEDSSDEESYTDQHGGALARIA
jgi:hypothetical protein